MSTCATIRIKSCVAWAPFFVINEADFDPALHTAYDPQKEAAEQEEAERQRLEAEAQIEREQAEARAAKEEADRVAAEALATERRSLDAESAAQGKTDDDDSDAGVMKVAELRAALTAKGIAFDPAAKKPALRALLEASEAA